MTCSIEGCSKPVAYKSRQICQMHYFRYMRNSSYNLKPKTRKQSLVTPNGYRVIYSPGHPLSRSDGYVFEHRLVAYSVYGDTLPNCEFCGTSCDWRPYYTHIDHIDCDKLNNSKENLRVLCNACNTGRNKPEQHRCKGRHPVTAWGETKTAEEWSRDSRVPVAGRNIRHRLRQGWGVEDALTTPLRKRPESLRK